MLPFLGSPTANINVTGALALCVFFAIHGPPVAKHGLLPYLKSMWPHLDVPLVLGIFLKPLIFGIEVIGVLVKNAVLAVRLFANMFAGHMVLATLLTFIFLAGSAGIGLWMSVSLATVFGIIGLSLLELFVAFLQAYVFVFLTSLFMASALHPQH
jgi:F-type H+-transporting ATPase subunit a